MRKELEKKRMEERKYGISSGSGRSMSNTSITGNSSRPIYNEPVVETKKFFKNRIIISYLIYFIFLTVSI